MAGRYVHPFPARMAPQIALDALENVRPGARVLDPMCGSGTVLRAAMEFQLTALGRDLDPLAVLMSRVATTAVQPEQVIRMAEAVAYQARGIEESDEVTEALTVQEIDSGGRASEFVRFWFAPLQERQLRALTLSLPEGRNSIADLLRLALSRTIVTKNRGASLARDVSHSRPHRVATSSQFDVIQGFISAVEWILRAIQNQPTGAASIQLGDARNLYDIDTNSIAAVVTSPPYLNAIDYMRGHRLALLWLGYSYEELADIRSSSIGAERAPDDGLETAPIDELIGAARFADSLSRRHINMLRRFAGDIELVLGEVARVLEPKGLAVVVIGNSMIKGTLIDNANVVLTAARLHGLQLRNRAERQLPPSSRYLPPPDAAPSSLSRRMRSEIVLTLQKP